MLPRPLHASLLAALCSVAPSGLWAFESMGCVATEICTAYVGCTDGLSAISLDLDWPGEAIVVTLNAGEPQRLEFIGNSFDAEAMSGVVSARGEGMAAVILAFRDGTATLTYAPGDDTSYRAPCYVQEAE